MYKICAFLILLLCGFVSQAQVNTTTQDTIKEGYSTGKIEIKDPQSIVKAYSYSPATGMYILSKTFGDFPTSYPSILTPKEYEDRVRKETMRKYFRDKLDAIDGKKGLSDQAKKDLLPRYYIKSGLFETIFGSNTIDIKPTGSIEMDFGVRYTKQDNPAFSPRNRSVIAFDFNQRINREDNYIS